MTFKVDAEWVSPIQYKPEVITETTPQTPQNVNADAKTAEMNFLGAKNRLLLEKQIPTEKPTPYGALEQINKLPKPDPNDAKAVAQYKAQCKQIADNAIKNSEPPKREDFKGLNGATAGYEYAQSLQYYNSQMSQLKKVSDEATRNPNRIITPSEAQTEIDNLPRPDRSDPQSVLVYNNKRAQIASDALLYAAPPKQEDYKGDRSEYLAAKTAYDKTIKRLTDDSYAQGSKTPPPLTEAEANTAADGYIKNHNGVKNEDDAYAVGKDVAELAKKDPIAAAAIMKKIQEKLNNTDYGDNVASGYVDNSSDADLQKLAGVDGGKAVLADLSNRLTTGSVHDSELNQARRITKAAIAANGSAPITFTTDGGVKAGTYITAPGTEVPQVTAQYIHDEKNVNIAKERYLQALSQHKDDPQWLSNFYKTLGTDKTAELITNVSNSLPPPTESQRKLVGQSLQTIVKGGFATQADIDTLVTKVISARNSDLGGLNRGTLMFLADAVSSLPNDAAGVQLKNMFSTTISKIAAGQLPTAINDDLELENAKNLLAAVATHVISTTPENNQAQQLSDLQTTLGKSGFNDLITRAMKFDKEFYDQTTREQLKNYDGIGTLLKNVGKDPNAPESLKVQLFDIASHNLTDSSIAEKYRDNVDFKEGLGNIFLKNQDAITKSYLGENGFDLSNDGLKNLNAFFRETLFTPPLASNAKDVAKDFTTKANTILADADKLSDGDFQAKYKMNKHDMTSLVGEQYGVLVHSMKEALAKIKDQSDEDGKQTMEVINGIITAGQIGIAAAGPEGVAVAILGEPLKLALGGIGDDIAEGKYDDAIKELKDKGIDPDKFDSFAVNEVLTKIDNPVAHDSFRDAFTYVEVVLG